ncbi:MAG: F0F1 ATP synthase subunit alpha, partial [Desulfovibrionales bacterium]
MQNLLQQVGEAFDNALDAHEPDVKPEEIGRVISVSEGVVWVEGIRSVKSEELLLVGPKEIPGMALEILPAKVGVVLLGSGEGLRSGAEVTRANRVLDVPVGM